MLFSLFSLLLFGTASLAAKPNFVFILADDQDVHLDSLSYMPLLRQHMTERGTNFSKHYCTVAQCCPSRVTLWTGKAAHNTNVTDVKGDFGGYPQFVRQKLAGDYFPVWLQNHGYNTYYTGKLMNGMTKVNQNQNPVQGWTGSDLLLDPYMYTYYNATMKRNKEDPVSYTSNYSTDVIRNKGINFIEDAHATGKPFFVGIAPIAPHTQTNSLIRHPVPAKRHEGLFPNATVPRTGNFNPEKASGASYVKHLPQQNDSTVAYNDEFYRYRLRALQAVDELVEGVVNRVDSLGLLNNTYIIYSSDNGYHIGQHRMNPGKSCAYETDINVPLVIRGPGIEAGAVKNFPTTHTDLAPTIFSLAGLDLRDDFDGVPIPVSETDAKNAKKLEHVGVEFWGDQHFEGQFGGMSRRNNTYKSLRVIGDSYNLAYTVWCTNEHELYDMSTDEDQMNNLVPGANKTITIGGKEMAVPQVAPRLDALIQVLRTCQNTTCVEPWKTLHPNGDVKSLGDALDEKFDKFYVQKQIGMKFDSCPLGYFPKLEGPGPIPYSDSLDERDLDWESWI